jgi:hypothetical protein
MRPFLFAAAAVALSLGLVACETPTPYQAAAPGPYSASGYGYSDTKIDDTHWRVSFSGNSLTARETVEKYLLYRAAELTRQQGFDWFQATDRATDKQTSFYGDDPYYGGLGWGPRWSFGGPWGWRAWGPWGGPGWPGGLDVEQVNRFEASAEIDMGHGAVPENRRAFNAAQVIQNLGPSIARSKS